MSSFWSWYVILLVVVNFLGCAWLLHSSRKNPKKDIKEDEPLEHSYDGIQELNNPLPRWWLWLFWLTLIFSVVYLVLYPGFGNFKGLFGWTQASQHQAEVATAQKEYAPLFAKYAKVPVHKLAKDPAAMQMGKRLFANHCAACHGADAQGAVGYPNLVDGNWLYGSSPAQIEETILNGRVGMMPPMAAAIGGDAGVEAVVAYVRHLNGLSANRRLLKSGQAKFNVACAACHGANAKGNTSIGAPNLTNDKWLFGGSELSIAETINKGRSAQMPAQKALLGPEKVHILAAYIYSLSHGANVRHK